jgi:mannose-6-phosphate isomerase-like protein (cupin superfamily)
MRDAIKSLLLGLLMAVVFPADRATAEIRDVLKSAEIDAMFARTVGSLVAHETPVYQVVFKVIDGEPDSPSMNSHADEIWFVRSGHAQLAMGDSLIDPKPTGSGRIVGASMKPSRQYEIGGGDIVNLPRNTAYQVNPGDGRVAYVAVRVFPETAHPDRMLPEPAPMADVLTSSARDAVFADNDSNQPLHSVPNLNVNYVIYKGRPGPWEAHRGCVDIYFVHTGSGIAHLGGEITDPVEEAPGEIRGNGVRGARTHEIGRGDIVLIPYHTAHYMVPTADKLGYNLVKVWAQESAGP